MLLLDEPTIYLDLSAQMELMEMLKKLTGDGKTVVTILHDLNQALQYAEEIVLMDNGRLKQCGTSEEILSSGALEDVFCVNAHILQDNCGKNIIVFQQYKKQKAANNKR